METSVKTPNDFAPKNTPFCNDFQSRVGHFKPGFLNFPWSKMENLSAHWEENYLSFSKLTQLLSVGQI